MIRLPRGSVVSAVVLLAGAVIYGAAWHNERLYVPLHTVDLISAKPPVRFPFRARSSEQYEIRFWFHIGDHSPEDLKHRLNIERDEGRVSASDVIDLKWRVTLSSGEPVATGSMQYPFSGYGVQKDAFAPLWPPINLKGEQDYALEVSFPPEDEFIRSLKPTVTLTISRDDEFPVFPILYPIAKVALVFGLVSTIATVIGVLARRKTRNTNNTANNPDRAPQTGTVT